MPRDEMNDAMLEGNVVSNVAHIRTTAPVSSSTIINPEGRREDEIINDAKQHVSTWLVDAMRSDSSDALT